ncbi:MAG: response regulator [Magnetococcales bacterium]|nr:response regulator [Magnetococcales bacterium]
MSEPTPRGVRLLAVDDRPDNLLVLEALLEEYLPGCDLMQTTSAREGLAIAARQDLDGALIDLRMPEMDGIAFCRRLKADPATAAVPVLLVTAHDSSTDIRTRGLEAGAEDFISKPIDARELVAKIKVMLRGKEHEDLLRRQRQQAEEKNRRLEAHLFQTRKLEAIGTLAGGIAHDFNNLLSSIIGYTELALRHLDGQPLVRSQLHTVLSAGLRATELVHQILTFSRESGPLPLERVALIPLLKETLQLLKTRLPDRITVVLDLDPEAGAVLCHPIQMQQIFMNLCTNAAQAMADRDGQLTIRLHNAPSGQTLELTVEDTGCGMAAETLARVFDPFFSTRPPGEGTGLGLSIVYGIVQTLGGTIRADSQPRVGSRFHLSLPRAAPARGPGVQPASWTGDGAVRDGHVLVVDDDLDLVYVCKTHLEQAGFKVTGTTSAQDAWRRFLQQRDSVDLLLTNQSMPEMTGVQLARMVQQARPGLPIVLMSGGSGALLSEEMADAGITRLLPKPFRHSALVETIRHALAGGGDGP